MLEKATGRWVGHVGPWEPEGWPEREVGWALRRSVWGKGYATEAACGCLDFVFRELRWSRVAHMIDPHNEASKAIAGRLGSQLLEEVRREARFFLDRD